MRTKNMWNLPSKSQNSLTRMKILPAVILAYVSLFFGGCISRTVEDRPNSAAPFDSIGQNDLFEFSNNIIVTDDSTIVCQRGDNCNYREVLLTSEKVTIVDDVLLSFLNSRIVPLAKCIRRENSPGTTFIIVYKENDCSYCSQEINKALLSLPVDYYLNIMIIKMGFGAYAHEIENGEFYVTVINNMPVLIESNIPKKIYHKTNEIYEWGKYRFSPDNIPLFILDDEVHWLFAMIGGKLCYILNYDCGCLISRGLHERDYDMEMDSIILNQIDLINKESNQNITDTIFSADNDTIFQ